MIAHLFVHDGRIAWSDYGASGYPVHAHALIIDVGRGFIITTDGPT